ncbi:MULTISPECIES: dihydrofolate reductase [unclassified Streptomyces]|uniref:dihydrofolate reductase n=1 Tax=unclassified Streptomyces TaxID=2593676 RepID=UPI00236500C2|nr:MULTISPECIES: dihydrofolate reductase [unclassified Streptomyces]MDF3143044.1 dihydrofolate reductase [Streptomyces sp. T21Q-yed]WDF44446.1 dihydrofolate reductase [Streptomyces sp. T12]
MDIGLIWAQTLDGVIGADNAIPWRLPEDMAHFKATTLGHPVIMGRKTWDSLPARFRPLPGRRNIVVTRDPLWTAEGAQRAGSIDTALELAAESPEPTGTAAAWVIGGGEIYRAALPYARTLSVTEVDAPLSGDTYAPPLDPTWRITEDTGWRCSTTGLRHRIRRYTRP